MCESPGKAQWCCYAAGREQKPQGCLEIAALAPGVVAMAAQASKISRLPPKGSPRVGLGGAEERGTGLCPRCLQRQHIQCHVQ